MRSFGAEGDNTLLVIIIELLVILLLYIAYINLPLTITLPYHTIPWYRVGIEGVSRGYRKGKGKW